MNCKGHCIALPKWHDLGAALHTWPLFGQDELATGEVRAGLREKDRDLDREYQIAVEVLVKAVEITLDILQQQRRCARLACVVASFEERGMVAGIAVGGSQKAVPLVGHTGKVRIERRSQAAQEVGKRVFEVAILAPSETVSRHVDMASEVPLVRIEGGDSARFLGR